MERYAYGSAKNVTIYLDETGSKQHVLSASEILFFSTLERTHRQQAEDSSPNMPVMDLLRKKWFNLGTAESAQLYYKMSEVINSGPGSAYILANYFSMMLRNDPNASLAEVMGLAKEFIAQEKKRFGADFDNVYGIMKPTLDIVSAELGKMSGTTQFFAANVADLTEGNWYYLGFDTVARSLANLFGMYNKRNYTIGSQFKAKLNELQGSFLEMDRAFWELRNAAARGEGPDALNELRFSFWSKHGEFIEQLKEAQALYKDSAGSAVLGTICAALTPVVAAKGFQLAKSLPEIAYNATKGMPAPLARAAGYAARQLTPKVVGETALVGIGFDLVTDRRILNAIGIDAGSDGKILNAFEGWVHGKGDIADVLDAVGISWYQMEIANLLFDGALRPIGRLGKAALSRAAGLNETIARYAGLRVIDTAFTLARLLKKSELKAVGNFSVLEEIASKQRITPEIVNDILKKHTGRQVEYQTAEMISQTVNSAWKSILKEIKNPDIAGNLMVQGVRVVDRLIANISNLNPRLEGINASWNALSTLEKGAMIFSAGALSTGTAAAGLKLNSEINLVRELRRKMVFGLLGYKYSQVEPLLTRDEQSGTYELDKDLVGERFKIPKKEENVYQYIAREVLKAQKGEAANPQIIESLNRLSEGRKEDLYKICDEYCIK
ncbi:MAG: hypothetical protein PHS02_02925 [Candidatus ainarchaeum sp.]|nr:hypothetical protein [Candidatus ainarchaeum sp.]